MMTALTLIVCLGSSAASARQPPLLSRRATGPHTTVDLIAAEAAAVPGKDLWLYGGGSLFRSFLDLGLVDGIDVAIVPVVLGHGLPLVPPCVTGQAQAHGASGVPEDGNGPVAVRTGVTTWVELPEVVGPTGPPLERRGHGLS